MYFMTLSSPPADRAWHAQDNGAVFAALAADENGLSAHEAQARLRRYGHNRLRPPPRRGPIARFLLQFNNVLIYVLLAAAAMTAALGHAVDTAVIIGVVIINALIGFIQEGKAEEALEAIRNLLSQQTAVRRDGQVLRVAADEVVPGDVVFLQSGDKVPAALRLFKIKSLAIDESILTGESLPVEKDTAPVAEDAITGDRRCMAYSGTFVTYGQGWGLVVASGERSEIGRISALLQTVEPLTTPLLRQLARFGRALTAVILFVAALIFAFGVVIRGYPVSEMFLAAVALAVAAIPEGLPAIMTITLAIGVQRMARRNAIIRRLPAVETLGSVTVICSDKTGTLTRNEMTVQAVVTAGERMEVSGSGYDPHGDFTMGGRIVDPLHYHAVQELIRAGILCNDATLQRQGGEWRVGGDPTEGALLALGLKVGFALKTAGADHRDLTFRDVEGGATMLGLVGMIDPPREEAIAAVRRCRTAGIRVKLLTGDHAATAVVIGRRIGIGEDSAALTGAELDASDDEGLRERVQTGDIFARTSPEHKLRLVTALQANGGVVAMTGDGVNDAPALKRADVGIAMGQNGTEVAKEAAEIVLADDNFASITHAVEEGRTVYDNLKKAILFILPTNGGEAFMLISAILIGTALPLTPVLILWVNMITTVTLALALAFEPPEQQVMRRPPRDPKEPLLSPVLVWRVVLVTAIVVCGAFGLFLWETARGTSLEVARTLTDNTVVMFEIFYLWNARYLFAPVLNRHGLLGNRYILAAVVLLLLFQLVFTHWSPAQAMLGTTDITWSDWLRIIAIASSVLFVVEIEKALLRRNHAHA